MKQLICFVNEPWNVWLLVIVDFYKRHIKSIWLLLHKLFLFFIHLLHLFLFSFLILIVLVILSCNSTVIISISTMYLNTHPTPPCLKSYTHFCKATQWFTQWVALFQFSRSPFQNVALFFQVWTIARVHSKQIQFSARQSEENSTTPKNPNPETENS